MTKKTAAAANTAATSAAAFALFLAWGVCMLFNMYGTPKRVPPINAPAFPYEIKVYKINTCCIMAGKGDKPRPLSVSYEKYAERYDAIFKKTVNKEDEKESSEDKASTKDD